MRWLHRALHRVKIYRDFIKWTKSVVLPGFGNLSIYAVTISLINEFLEDSLSNKASSLAYNFMLALFPGTLFLFTLIAYVPVDNFQDKLLELLRTIMPTYAYLALENTIEDIIKHQNAGLLSLGFITALYFATNGVGTLMQAFNNSSLILEKRTWLKRRSIATLLTVVISVALIIAIAIMIAGESAITYLQSHIASKSHFWIYLLTLSRWLIIVVIFFVTISILYRYGPSHKLKWPFLSPGSILATGLAILTSLGFTYYINHFASYNKVYGSIGTIIVVMLWLYLNSLILLIGFELNASIDLSKRNLKIVKPRLNTFKAEKL
ncbi:YihY/virulence factor BrkB family protein [Mucilaginibacter sp. UR6-11]|uniref:YihY/virulence factor BrkB family protein n=1 Tax=Mucilaginibacter sp. UR6-11 TaxID=1435644 RepID=UPI001E2FBF71|nr:YihY/virulence factor BrkB family protein [Mucilaginibacter sp. UR6-11]MCC8426954.1 YihY/virulence factor BrkB family protein [Mucilaginibacter sp. UR6-11]